MNFDELKSLVEQNRSNREDIRMNARLRLQSIDDQDIKAFLDTLAHGNADQKMLAIEAYSLIDPANAANYLQRFTVDANVDIRATIIWSIIDNQLPNSEDVLIKLARYDPNPSHRHQSIFALAMLGTHKSLPYLEHSSRHDKGIDYEGRFIADMAKEAILCIKARQEL